MLQNCCAVMAARRKPRRRSSRNRARIALEFSFTLNRFADVMDNLSGYAHRPFPFVLRYLRQRLRRTCGHTGCRCCSRCLLGGHAIWRQESGRQPVGGTVARRRRMAGIHFSHVADRRRQFSVAGRELDRELHLRRRHRRSAPRHVPSSDRPRAELFLRPAAGHADQPHHRDIQRGVHGRKHVRLERVAAVHRDGCGDCC